MLVPLQTANLANHSFRQPAHFVQVPCLLAACLSSWRFLNLAGRAFPPLLPPPPPPNLCCKGFLIIITSILQDSRFCLRVRVPQSPCPPLGPAMQVLLSRRCCTPLTPVPVFAANAVPARVVAGIMQKGSSPVEADSGLRRPSGLMSMETPTNFYFFSIHHRTLDVRRCRKPPSYSSCPLQSCHSRCCHWAAAYRG